MKKRFNLGTVLVLLVLVAVATYQITHLMVREELNKRLDNLMTAESESSKYLEAKQQIVERFVGDFDVKKIEDGAVSGMIASLGDQWSHYLTAEQYETLNSSDKPYVGIGVTAMKDPTTGYIAITEVFEKSGAMNSGLTAGDFIVKVDGKDVKDLEYADAIDLIKGEESTSVTLTVKHLYEATEKEVVVQRLKVTRQFVTSEIIDGRIGYIKVIAFESRVSNSVIEAIHLLENAGVEGYIFDMRDNPGGNLDELVNILDYILPEGTIITLKHKTGDPIVKSSKESCIDKPMAVLMNGDSYSAAEFFAACLKEYDWATTVGEPTTGKGYAQEHISMTDGSYLILSTQEYFTPKNVSLAGVGIKPDVLIEYTPEDYFASHIDRSKDTQLSRAVEVVAAKLPVATSTDLVSE